MNSSEAPSNAFNLTLSIDSNSLNYDILIQGTELLILFLFTYIFLRLLENISFNLKHKKEIN
jgi:hypothetical protein